MVRGRPCHAATRGREAAIEEAAERGKSNTAPSARADRIFGPASSSLRLSRFGDLWFLMRIDGRALNMLGTRSALTGANATSSKGGRPNGSGLKPEPVLMHYSSPRV